MTVLGAHILDVLGRPVEAIPPGQGSARLQEIRATAAGTAAGAGVDLAKLGARVLAIGALGDDLLGNIVVAAMARYGVDTSGLVRKSGAQTSATILPIRGNGERPALHVPGATRLLELADIDLDRVRRGRALLVGAPDALGGLTGADLTAVAAAARGGGALVAVDVLHPGRPQDLERLAGLLGAADWFLPNGDQLLALTGRQDLGSAIADVLALGTGGVAVTLGADGCLLASQRQPDAGRAARPAGRRRGHHRVRRRVQRRDARRAAARRRPRRRGVARPRLRLAGRHRPGLGRGDPELRPGRGLPEPLAAGGRRPD